MTDYRHKLQVKFLLLGIMVGFGLFLLLGAKSQDDVVLLASDRYRISAWGNSHSHGAFVVDSLTGKTKLVYQDTYQTTDDRMAVEGSQEEPEGSTRSKTSSVEVNHLGRLFTKIP